MTFDTDLLGFLVLTDGDRVPLGSPSRCRFRGEGIDLYWDPREVRRDGKTLGIVVVASTGRVLGSYIEEQALTSGCMFHGSVHLDLRESFLDRDEVKRLTPAMVEG